MNTDSAITTVLALAFTTTYCANLLIFWQFVWWSREKDVILQRRLQNYKQKREKHFVVSSAQMSTQKTGLADFPCEHAPKKIPKPYLQPFGHPHHKVKNRRFAPKVKQTLSLALVSPSF